jgi:hypothetical protein
VIFCFGLFFNNTIIICVSEHTSPKHKLYTQQAAAYGIDIFTKLYPRASINVSLPISSLICDAAVTLTLFVPIK